MILLSFIFIIGNVLCQVNISSANPTWITSPFFRAGNQAVITSLTGSGVQPQFTFTFSSGLVGIPSLAYGIKTYRGNDYFGQQYFQIRQIGLTSTTFSVEIQIYGITNIHILSVAYIAVEPNFPHHLNSFDNVPLNYSSGNIVNISVASTITQTFTQVINYSQQATGRIFTQFTGVTTSYKIVLFMTSLWITGSFSTPANPVQIHITPVILNLTHYQWTATVFKSLKVAKLQFSQIIFNPNDVESSRKYFIVFQQWITDIDGGFKTVPQQFVDNFIMAVTNFQTVDARCGFQYQWEFQNDTSTGQFGVKIFRSWTLTNTCGFSWARTSIFYMKTWSCNSPYTYFNLTTNLCQDMCHPDYIQNAINFTCDCQYGYHLDGSNCTQICGDGILFDLQCDDGNLLNGDGCSSICTIQAYFVCSGGDNMTKSVCSEICGDGRLFVDQCDDGNTISGDGCSSTCKIENGFSCSGGSPTHISTCIQICGDGIVNYAACDDGNLINGDGCSSNCIVELYYSCVNIINQSSICNPICGDGIIIINKQQCDDNNIISGDGCSSICKIQNGFSCVNEPSNCIQICGDGKVVNQECDDGNRINMDGCDENCTIEEGFSCFGGSLTSTSICQLNTLPSFDLLSFYKDPGENAFTITIQSSNLSTFAFKNIQQYLNFSFPYQSIKISLNQQTGVITLDFTYNQTLNSGKPLQITYTNRLSNSVTITLPQTTDNNLTLKLYNDNFYQTYQNLNKFMTVLSYLVVGAFNILFLTVSKLIAIEMIFVFQFTFCGLIMLKKLESLMDPYKILWITNSYNQIYTQEQDRLLPPRVTSIFYKSEFFSNFNMDFIIYFLPILVGLSFYIASKFLVNKKLKQYRWKLLKQWQISAMLFCEFQLSYALTLCIKYGTNKGIGIFFGLLLFLILILWAIVFIKWPQYFGQYKFFFKEDTFGQNFYVLVVIYRIILSFSMISFSQSILSPILSFIWCILWTILLLWKMPYKNNIRPISNAIVMVILSIFYIYSRQKLDEENINFATYLPLIIVILLVYTFFLNLFYFAKHFSENQGEQMDKKIRQQSQRVLQEKQKQSKSNRQEQEQVDNVNYTHEDILNENKDQIIQNDHPRVKKNKIRQKRSRMKSQKKNKNLKIEQTKLQFKQQEQLQ